MANLAIIYQGQKRWKEAEELALRVIELRQNALGPQHPDTVHKKAELVVSYSRQRRWVEAERLQLQVLEMKERILGPEHPDVMKSQSALAVIQSEDRKTEIGRTWTAENTSVTQRIGSGLEMTSKTLVSTNICCMQSVGPLTNFALIRVA